MCSGALGASSEWRRGGLLRQEIDRSLARNPRRDAWEGPGHSDPGVTQARESARPAPRPALRPPDQALFFLSTCPLIAFRFRSRWAHSGPGRRPNRRV